MNLKISQATSVEQALRDQVTYEGWGQRLSLDQYLLREKTLRAGLWGEHSIEMWLLKNEDGEVLSSCEIYPLLGDQVLGVGSVFTEEKWRGRGFAPQLLRELSQYLVQRAQSAQALVLFSEVDERIYERAGFHSVDSYEWVIQFRSWEAQQVSSLKGEERGSLQEKGWRWILCTDDLERFCQFKTPDPHFDSYVSSSLRPYRRRFIREESGDFLIVPSSDQLRWHFLRESIYAQMLGRLPSQCVGVEIERGGVVSFLIWMLDHKWDCLRVLVASFANPEVGRDLLSLACSYAQKHGLSELRMWETQACESQIFENESPFHAERVKREDSIAMIHPLSEETTQGKWRGIQRGLWI